MMKDGMIQTSNKTYCGIDYSMTLPCLCLHDHHGYEFHYLTKQKKYDLEFEVDDITVVGHIMPYWEDDTERWDVISKWVMDCIYDWQVDLCVLEDYSFSSTGRTFQIGENFGLLKYKLRRSMIPFMTVPPTVLKKFATGKGNANKERMQEAYVEETGRDLKKLLGQTEKQWNPSSDIIDSYYLAEYGKHYEMERRNSELELG
jgi:Holliday junction resolvasome RuvABC endonuclease subunit